MDEEKKEVNQRTVNIVGTITALVVTAIMILLIITNSDNSSESNITRPSYYNQEYDHIYTFEEGLTPIIHAHSENFWLCQNENGEYIRCTPTIERRVK